MLPLLMRSLTSMRLLLLLLWHVLLRLWHLLLRHLLRVDKGGRLRSRPTTAAPATATPSSATSAAAAAVRHEAAASATATSSSCVEELTTTTTATATPATSTSATTTATTAVEHDAAPAARVSSTTSRATTHAAAGRHWCRASAAMHRHTHYRQRLGREAGHMLGLQHRLQAGTDGTVFSIEARAGVHHHLQDSGLPHLAEIVNALGDIGA
eukprot:m.122718 g.122718  ORF g.122718 m.122718 type:complete len:211 (+) comp16230_c0_seq1:90-722(+)